MKNEVKKKMNVMARAMVYQSHQSGDASAKTLLGAAMKSSKHANSRGTRDSSPLLVLSADSSRGVVDDALTISRKLIVFAFSSIYNEVANLRGSMINGGFRRCCHHFRLSNGGRKIPGKSERFERSQLGAVVVREAVKRAGLNSDQIDECIMGNVLPAGLGQNPARQAAIFAGLSPATGAMTINKVWAQD